MAGTYSPTISTFADPVVEIQSLDSTDYATIQSSLSSTAYVANSVHINSSSTSQLSQVLQFETYDSDGEIKVFSIKPEIDPWQKQKSFDIDFGKEPLIFDGHLKYELELLGNSNAQFDFYTDEVAPDAVEEEITEEGVKLKPLAQEERGKIKIKDYDQDFLNRSGFFEDLSTSLPEGQEIHIDTLFDEGWCEEL
jgi:hypothetical protein